MSLPLNKFRATRNIERKASKGLVRGGSEAGEAGLRFAAESFAIEGGQATGIKAVAIMEAQEFAEFGMQIGKSGIGHGAFEPVGKRLMRLAREAAFREGAFKLVKFGVEAGPGNGVGLSRTVAAMTPSAAEDDLKEE